MEHCVVRWWCIEVRRGGVAGWMECVPSYTFRMYSTLLCRLWWGVVFARGRNRGRRRRGKCGAVAKASLFLHTHQLILDGMAGAHTKGYHGRKREWRSHVCHK